MSSARVARSEALLAAISRKVGISEDGKQWLIAALDPFHDNPIHCNGFPDNRSDASVVQCVKQSVQISCPTSITTGTWDAHFTSYPFLESANYRGSTDLNEGANGQGFTLAGSPTLCVADATIFGQVGGIGVFLCPTGTTFGSTNTAQSSYTSIPCQDQYLRGAVRCIATGFEVVNTTSPLNVQGLCTVWRSPTTDYNETNSLVFGSSSGGTNTSAGMVNAWVNAGPPTSIAQAMLLADSKQWHAKEGCYVVPTLNTTNVGLQYELGLVPVFTNPGYPTSGQGGFSNQVGSMLVANGFLNTVSGSTSSANIAPAINTYTNFNLGGAIFTGLSLQTTLTVTWNLYIERFPANEATDLIVLATPSPLYDPQALELYASVVQHMPPGVMVKENGLGDWFQSAIGFAKDVISPVLSVIPHPVAQVANAALRGVSGVNDAIKNRQGNSAAQAVPRPMIKAAAEKKKPAVRANKALELRIAAAKKKMGK